MAGKHAAWLVAGALAGALAVCAPCRASDALLAQGCAAMGQFEFEKAAALFQQAVAANAAAWEPRFDLAVALLNQSRPGAQEEAIQHLQKLAAERPDDLAVPYCHGLAALYLGNAAEAAPLFARVAAARPADAYAQFYAAQCAELGGDLQAARAMYQQAAAVDPLLRSAWLGVQRTAGRLGDAAAADAALATFKALADNPRSPLAEFKYTKMGSLAMPAVRAGKGAAALPQGAPVQLGAAAPLRMAGAPGPLQLHAAGAPTTVDLNGDGLSDLVYAGTDTQPRCTVLLQQADGAWAAQPSHPLAAVQAAGLLWGDLNNDGRVDVVVNPPAPQPAYALLQQADGAWTRAALAAADAALGRAWALADLDADGDLDLVVDWGGVPGLLLSRADGTFEARSVGAGVPAGRLQQALVADLTSDGLPDLLLVQAGDPAPVCTVWRAGVLWQWERVPDLGGAGVAAAVPVIDQRDGAVLVAMLRQPVGAAAAATQLELAVAPRGRGASSALRQVIHMPGAEGLSALGVDGAGQSVLLVHGHAPQGGQPWLRAVQQRAGTGESSGTWAVVAEATLPSTGAQPLVLSPGGMRVLLPAEGAGAPPRAVAVGSAGAPLAAVWLKGRLDPSQQMRSNASGIGTRWTAWCADRWVSGQAFAAAGQAGPQQSLAPCLVPPAAFITLDWPDGVLQTELDVQPGVRTLAETQRQISSCPVIFAWNGQEHAFVTDCLGVGGLGYLVGAERQANGALKPVYAPPRPWERVVLGGADALQAVQGSYDVRLTEPMEEACYLDAASLRAYDVPEGWHVALDERMGINGPGPTGQVHAYRTAVVPVRAMAQAGAAVLVDATAALAARDGAAAPLGAPDPRFIGRLAEPAMLTLEFGVPLAGAAPRPDAPRAAPAGTPVLLLDGWVEYPYCQTNFAMWQAGVSAEAPSLDALDPATGAWVELVPQYGYPAGMQRQCMFMLPADRMPPGCTTLRLRTTMELYVDRVQVAWLEPCAQLAVQEAPLWHAACRFAGYPQRVPQPQRRPDYQYASRTPLWDCRAQVGFYTQYGPCTPLLAKTDDACAVFGPGEEVELRFAAVAPPAAGMQRTWVLDVNGWCKDMDRYTGQGVELSPMPTRNGTMSAEARALQQQFNTRFAGGRP